jgi:hypothetical protein
MLERDEIRDPMKAPEMQTAIPEAGEALKIEEVLRRAREIHRRHGGIFGYDFEDWVQAWSGLPASKGRTDFELAGEIDSQAAAGETEEVSKSCFRYDN